MWTFNDEKYLLDNIKESKIEQIALDLNKSVPSVEQKLRRMKISKRKKCEYPGIFWNKWDKKWIIYVYEDNKVWLLDEYKTLNEAKDALFKYKILKMPL